MSTGFRILGVGSLYGVGFSSLFALSTKHKISSGPEWGRKTKAPSHSNKYGNLIKPSAECQSLSQRLFIYFYGFFM
jgi:hypothetical protein